MAAVHLRLRSRQRHCPLCEPPQPSATTSSPLTRPLEQERELGPVTSITTICLVACFGL